MLATWINVELMLYAQLASMNLPVPVHQIILEIQRKHVTQVSSWKYALDISNMKIWNDLDINTLWISRIKLCTFILCYCITLFIFLAPVPPIGPPEIAVGCSNDQECPDWNACFNSQCKDPCASDPCAIEAFCSTHNHQARCSCPEGWTGDPKVKCIPRKIYILFDI